MTDEVTLREHFGALFTAEMRRLDIEARVTRIETVVAERQISADQRYRAQETAIRVAEHTAEVALAEAKILVKDGFEKNNEWRGSINDVIVSRLSRSEYDTAHKSLIDKVDAGISNLSDRLSANESRMSQYEGRSSGIGSSVSTLIAIGAVAIALVFGVLSYSSSHSVPALVPAPAAVAVVPLQPPK